MKPLLKLIALLFAAGSLSACAYSVERLVNDDYLRGEVLKDCVSKGLKAKDDQNCINATKAQAQVTGNKIKSLFD